MGGGGSKQAQLERYGQLLSPAERQALETTFHAIAGSQEAAAITETQLRAYLTRLLFLPAAGEDVCRGVFRALGGDATDRATFPDFVRCASHLLRGSLTQRSERLHVLCRGSLVTLRETLLAFLVCLFSEGSELSELLGLSAWPCSSLATQALATHLTNPLAAGGLEVGVSSKTSISVEDIESWLASSLAVGRLLDVAFGVSLFRSAVRSSQPPAEVAGLVGLPLWETDEEGCRSRDTQRVLIPLRTQNPVLRGEPASLLLTPAALLMINSFLPAEVRGQLRPLFISGCHGKSFSTLCKGLVGSGPTLLVVQDTGGHVFGGFAAVPWHFGPQFIGNSECFLFSLVPDMAVFTCTGYNTNYMYLQQSAQTMPNGLGMGGQLQYCGLWLSGEFDSGHSQGRPSCTTYGSPSLSSTEDFTVAAVEAWGVGPRPRPEDKEGGGQVSILDKDKAAGHLLEMAGKTRHSEGLREPSEDS